MRRIPTSRPKPAHLVLLLAGAALLPGQERTPAAPAGFRAPAGAYRTAPEFSRVDLDRKKVSLAAARGKVVLLNFWATWCSPCLAEVPRFAEWQQRYGGRRGLQVIGISMDDEEAPVRAVYQKFKVTYPVVMGDETIGESYGGVLGVPITFLIDRQGRIRFRHEGVADLAVIEREMQELLAQP